MDAARSILEREMSSRRRAVVVEDMESHRDSGLDVEKDGHLPTRGEILRRVANVEPDRRLALPGLGAIDQGHEILDTEAVQPLGHGRAREHLDLDETSRI